MGGWIERAKRFVLDHEDFIRGYPEQPGEPERPSPRPEPGESDPGEPHAAG